MVGTRNLHGVCVWSRPGQWALGRGLHPPRQLTVRGQPSALPATWQASGARPRHAHLAGREVPWMAAWDTR